MNFTDRLKFGRKVFLLRKEMKEDGEITKSGFSVVSATIV